MFLCPARVALITSQAALMQPSTCPLQSSPDLACPLTQPVRQPWHRVSRNTVVLHLTTGPCLTKPCQAVGTGSQADPLPHSLTVTACRTQSSSPTAEADPVQQPHSGGRPQRRQTQSSSPTAEADPVQQPHSGGRPSLRCIPHCVRRSTPPGLRSPPCPVRQPHSRGRRCVAQLAQSPLQIWSPLQVCAGAAQQLRPGHQLVDCVLALRDLCYAVQAQWAAQPAAQQASPPCRQQVLQNGMLGGNSSTLQLCESHCLTRFCC